MHNADRLLQNRKRGIDPLLVCIDLDFKTKVDRFVPLNDEYPDLHIEPKENIRRLDLRCLYGVPVKVVGFDAGRVKAVVQACKEAEAARVIGCVYVQSGNQFLITDVTDTEGILTWQDS
jgi:hypothetical protein